MLKTLKSKRKRFSKGQSPPGRDVTKPTTNTQDDIFCRENQENIPISVGNGELVIGNASQSFLHDDSFIDSLDLDHIEQQVAQLKEKTTPPPPPPGFSERDRKMKFRSPVGKTSTPILNSPPDHSTSLKHPVPSDTRTISPRVTTPDIVTPGVAMTTPDIATPARDLCTTTPIRKSARSHPSAPEIGGVSSRLEFSNLSQFTGSFFLTPRGCTLGGATQQRQLYATGLMSPYTSSSNETVRLGVPEEVFKLISKIRGINNLYPWQEKTVAACLTGGNHIIKCPTSGGKTLVGELLLLNAILTRCTDALLILPYVSLVEEKVRELAEFAEHFSFGLERYAGSRGKLPPRKRVNKRTIYVATIEKANSLFNSLYEEGRCSEIGVIVVDELHMIGDGRRGAILETCLSKFLSLKPGPRITGMTATLSNDHEIASFLKCSMEHSGGARPVVLREYVKIGDTIHTVDKDTQELVAHRQATPIPSQPSIPHSDTDCVASLVLESLPECVLVFCPTKSSCETSTRMLAALLPGEPEEDLRKKREVLLTRMELETGHVESLLKESIPRGICYHHSGLTADERVIVEEAFCSGTLCVLCCTSTLAAGVNLPAARVIIRSVKIGTGFLTRTRYLQMVGRAGRTGLSSSGDSFIIGMTSQRKLLHELVFGEVEEVRSCLDTESLALTLLHLIGSGMISSMADLGMFMKRTLLHIQQPDESMRMVEEALNFLEKSQFIAREQGAITSTSFGKAVYKSSLDPNLAHAVLSGLRDANKHLVLQGDLHLVFLCVPPDIQNVIVDWMMFFNAYSQFDDVTRTTFSAAGLEEAFLARRAFSQNKSDEKIEVTYKRFYLAGALHKILGGVPVWNVSSLFKIPRGTLQSSLNSAITHASKLALFTKEMPEYWAMSAVFDALVKKLVFAGAPELAQILEIPGVKHARARQLYKAGYHTLQKLVAAEPRLLAAEIDHLSQQQAQKIISSAKILLQEQADALTDAALQLLETGA